MYMYVLLTRKWLFQLQQFVRKKFTDYFGKPLNYRKYFKYRIMRCNKDGVNSQSGSHFRNNLTDCQNSPFPLNTGWFN